MRRLILLLFVVALLAALGWLLFAPTTLEPPAWEPDPVRADLATENQDLSPLHRVELGERAHGPEDVALAADGMAYMGLADGRILRVDPDSEKSQLLVNTGGRPLGLDFDQQGRLIVADAVRGLLSINIDDGAITTLATEADGLAFGLTDDVEVGPDGRVYFTDASADYALAEYRMDILEGAGSGRLLVYSPDLQRATTLMDGLMFANGVAVSPEGDFVLVVETGRYRVWRLWLQGELAGRREIFIAGLPGFPDGVSRGEHGRFWIPLAAPRSLIIDSLAPWPLLRKILSRVPPELFPGPGRWSYVLGINADGVVLNNLQQPGGYPLAYITSVQEYQGRLYLGSLHETAFGIYQLH